MKNTTLDSFLKGALAGLVALGFLLVLRFADIAPFPPESAFSAVLKVIPEKIQEPSIQKLGSFAGEAGLIVATIICAAVYGVFGVLFASWFSKSVTSRRISKLEKSLIFSIIPFLFFGVVVLPVSGDSFFGTSSGFASSSSVYIFPVSLLIGNFLYGITLNWFGIKDKMLGQKQPIRKEIPAASRRAFVEKGALALGALALLVTGIDNLLTSQAGTSISGSPQGSSINVSNAPSIFDDPRLANLMDSEVTANSQFYQVDIDVFTPNVNSSTWTLQLTGLVQNPKSYTLEELQALPKTVEYNTFECVSNNVNGNLISNAQWGGVKLSDLFSDAGGVSSGAVYVVFYSVDGYSVGIPLAKAMMSDSILAYEMNGVPLPQNHGYPLRAVNPGLYGMMSAKWIRKISIIDTTYAGYWQTRGWSDTGVVQTLAFITTPADGASQSLSSNNGTALVGGFAYAGDRGISKVEVSIDEGKTWQPAVIKPLISNDTWALWAFEWTPAQTGTVNVYARATDGTGAVQTSTETGNFPSGATGYVASSLKITK